MMQSMEHRRQIGRRPLAVALIAGGVAFVLVALALLFPVLERMYLGQLGNREAPTLTLAVEGLNGSLRRFEALPGLIAERPELVQALRAVAPLQEVRLQSHRLMAQQFAEIAANLLDTELDEALLSRARVSVDAGYAIVELALEDDAVSAEHILREGSRMIQAYWAGTPARPTVS